MTDLPAPLTPADCNLQAFRDMPLDTVRMRGSDLLTEESAEAIVAALHLWMAAWHQVPAASLPDNDRALAKAAGYGRSVEAWMAVRDGALRGFVRCSDGRIYHRVLAEKANDAWDKRLRYEWAKAGDRHRKAQKKLPEAERTEFQEFDDWKAGRPIPAASPPRQPSLPLEQPQDFQRNDPHFPAEQSSERAHAHTERACTERARTGASTVPDELSDGNTDTFQRNGAAIPAENALKGREGKGNESITLPDPPSSHAHARTGAKPMPEPDKPSRLDDTNLQALFDAVCEAAGFNPVSPGQIDLAYAKVQAWRDAGIDFDEVVVPTIRHTVANSSDPTRTLGRFDKAIRHEHARRGAKAASGAPYVPPPSPIVCREDEEPVFALMRQDLLERMGAIVFCQVVNHVRFDSVDMEGSPSRDGVERKPVQVKTLQPGRPRLMDGDRVPIVRAVALKHGFNEVW